MNPLAAATAPRVARTNILAALDRAAGSFTLVTAPSVAANTGLVVDVTHADDVNASSISCINGTEEEEEEEAFA